MARRSAWRRALAFVLMLLSLAGQPALAAAVTDVGGADLDRLIAGGATVIDVRRADEWRETGIIPGSRLITAYGPDGSLDPGFLAAVAAAAGPGDRVVLICRSGNRSAKAAELLAGSAGYTRLYNVEGGVRGWAAAGHRLEPCPTC